MACGAEMILMKVIEDMTMPVPGFERHAYMCWLAITRVELRPKIAWVGDRAPSAEQLDKMHHGAHENCFIANSVKTDVTKL
jgi:hypothetical protein